MQYRCPKCQSVKIMPVSQGVNSPRPNVPKSLVLLVPAIFIETCSTVIPIKAVMAFPGMLKVNNDGTGLTIVCPSFFIQPNWSSFEKPPVAIQTASAIISLAPAINFH